MRKAFLFLLDGLIILALLWFLFFKTYINVFSNFLWLVVVLILAIAVIVAIYAVFAERARNAKKIENERIAIALKTLEQQHRELKAIEDDRKRKVLAAEHEARRPICTHCGKKTEFVFRYRRLDGGPDSRYRDNPMLCNKCFKPYSPIRPWNLPTNA